MSYFLFCFLIRSYLILSYRILSCISPHPRCGVLVPHILCVGFLFFLDISAFFSSRFSRHTSSLTCIDPVLNLISMSVPSLAHLKSPSCSAYTRPLLCDCASVVSYIELCGCVSLVSCIHVSSPMWLCGSWPENPAPGISCIFCIH